MKVGVLFSGGKDSTYAAYLADQQGYEISCLITIESLNKDSFMFHTPSISKVERQAESMQVPLIVVKTRGEKEKELVDLEKAVKNAINKYGINGIITGAVESVYQASRVQRICNKLGIECFNPLWQKDQIELLKELIENRFEAIIVGVAAYPLNKEWLGRKIDKQFISDMKKLNEKYKLNPAGEGGEFESFIIYCPLFKHGLKINSFEDSGQGNSWRREIEIE